VDILSLSRDGKSNRSHRKLGDAFADFHPDQHEQPKHDADKSIMAETASLSHNS
jgi:hypothetical protein